MDHIHSLEKEFTVSPEKLKEITNHFVSELEKGLSKEGGSIVSFSLFLAIVIFIVVCLYLYTANRNMLAYERHLGHGLAYW